MELQKNKVWQDVHKWYLVKGDGDQFNGDEKLGKAVGRGGKHHAGEGEEEGGEGEEAGVQETEGTT